MVDFITSVSEFYYELLSVNKKYKLINLTTSRRKDEGDGSDSDVDATDFPPVPKSSRGKRVTKSRNAVINEWLALEESGDCYADLEDFIVT